MPKIKIRILGFRVKLKVQIGTSLQYQLGPVIRDIFHYYTNVHLNIYLKNVVIVHYKCDCTCCDLESAQLVKRNEICSFR